MKILDLFCKAGGATKGYQLAGFYVVGVDIEPQPHYCGNEFLQADALRLGMGFLTKFDAIHASPPCQAYSSMQHIHKNKDKHPDLIDETRQLLKDTAKLFVIENVSGSPLHAYSMLCGTFFGLQIAKHRYFETNFPMPLLTPPCDHRDVIDFFHGGIEAREERIKLSKIMKIDWPMTRDELRNAIPPAYTEFIGQHLIKALKAIEPRGNP